MRQELAVDAVIPAHGRAAGHRTADQAFFHDVLRGLHARTKERIRRDAEAKPLFVRQRDEFSALFELDRDHLFREDVLSGEQCALRHRVVRSGGCEVDHEFDAAIREDFVQRHRADSETLRALAHARLVHVRAGDEFQYAEPPVCQRLHIDRADRAAAHDRRSHSLHINVLRSDYSHKWFYYILLDSDEQDARLPPRALNCV
ncbi:hypothetical protein SDC9_148889 [bioreactor metagenome]|uniref:Uncharacterized protein n=1 Tax=bioreactor metagenome TaxID=1076179 RepID=A0A645EI47_9ZZZZ